MFFIDKHLDCIWESLALASFVPFLHINAKSQLFRRAIADVNLWEVGCAKAEKLRRQFRTLACLSGSPLSNQTNKKKRAVAFFGCRKLKRSIACFWPCPTWAKAPDSPSCFDPITAAAPVLSKRLSHKTDKGNDLPNANCQNLKKHVSNKVPSNLLGASCKPTPMSITLWLDRGSD